MLTSNDIIFTHRGDDLQFRFIINRGSNCFPDYYSLGDNDHLLLSICEANQPFESGVIRKEFTEDNNEKDSIIISVETPGGEVVQYSVKPVIITISGDDTINLLPGTYYYSFKLCHGIKGASITETVLSRKKFVILE